MNVLQHRFRRFAPRFITVLGIIAISLGATSKSCQIANDDNDDDDDVSLTVQLHLEDASGVQRTTFRESTTIRLVLRVTNQLDERARVQFSTGRTHDFVILESGEDRVVWQFSEDEPFPDGATELVFEPNETVTFTAVWDQRRQSSNLQVQEGTYEARGALFFSRFDADPRDDNEFGSPIVSFTITD